MSETQNNQRKKNILLIIFMLLLIVFVCIMCYIVIYAKNQQKFLSPDEISIKQTQSTDYVDRTAPEYEKIINSTKFTITEDDKQYDLQINETDEIVILRGDSKEVVNIMQNDNNINSKIKVIYQTEYINLILTSTGELYKMNNTEIIDGELQVGQILTNTKVNDIVYLRQNSDAIYAIDENGKLINVDTAKEFNGVIKEIKTSTSTIYVYKNNGFGIEEGKLCLDENGNVIIINLSFDNKIISENNVIYEINPVDNTLSTSKLGVFSKVWYRKNPDDGTYKITLLSNTGYNDFISTYYYQ